MVIYSYILMDETYWARCEGSEKDRGRERENESKRVKNSNE